MPPPTSMSENAFTMLTFIAAPAVLTNAASVLALGTSNRFARAVDRARILAKQVTEDEAIMRSDAHVVLVRQFNRVQKRSLLLLTALRCFYGALGSFAAAALTSLIGAGLAESIHHWLYQGTVGVALSLGIGGVASMVWGCSLLVGETRLAIVNLSEEADLVRDRSKHFRERLETIEDHDDTV